MSIRNIVILTGAGISAESGIATFRGPGGLWEGQSVEDVCTPEALRVNPELVHQFYDQRRVKLTDVRPNAAHEALARLDREWRGELLIVTQNVDDLHERAGATRLHHMHGRLLAALCSNCEVRIDWTGDLPVGSVCQACKEPTLRPDIVFFGEVPYEMDRIEEAIGAADLFASIGTSGAVYPAANFVRMANNRGAMTLELNLHVSDGTFLFTENRLGLASRLVPRWVDEVLTDQKDD